VRELEQIELAHFTPCPSPYLFADGPPTYPLRIIHELSSLTSHLMSRPEVHDYDLPQGDQRPAINFSIPVLSNQDRTGSSRLTMSQKSFPSFVPRSVAHADPFLRHTQDTFMGTHPNSQLDPRVLPNSHVNPVPYNQLSPNQQSTPHIFAQPTSRFPSSSSFHLSKPSPTSFLPYNDRDTYISRTTSQSNPHIISPQPSTDTTSTLLWGDLEPWMDEEYAKQVCMIMHWDPINVKVPKPATDPANGPQANNRGYCYLTFSNCSQPQPDDHAKLDEILLTYLGDLSPCDSSNAGSRPCLRSA
jgi:hypothetical protein